MNTLTAVTELSPSDIADFLPHGRGMSLIEKVTHCEEEGISCIGMSHLDPLNPMFHQGSFQSITLVEYAAQSIAIHAGLLNRQLAASRPAFIGGFKNIEIPIAKLPNRKTKIDVKAVAEFLSPGGAIYSFTVLSDDEVVISGRLTLVQPPEVSD